MLTWRCAPHRSAPARRSSGTSPCPRGRRPGRRRTARAGRHRSSRQGASGAVRRARGTQVSELRPGRSASLGSRRVGTRGGTQRPNCSTCADINLNEQLHHTPYKRDSIPALSGITAPPPPPRNAFGRVAGGKRVGGLRPTDDRLLNRLRAARRAHSTGSLHALPVSHAPHAGGTPRGAPCCALRCAPCCAPRCCACAVCCLRRSSRVSMRRARSCAEPTEKRSSCPG